MRSHRRLRRGALVLVFGVLAVALAGCDAGTSGSAAATATPLPTTTRPPTPLPAASAGQQLPAFNGSLGPAPGNCPASPPLRDYQTSDFGGGFSGHITFQGGKPVWEMGLGRVIHLVRDPSGYYTTKVMWVVGPDYAQPVTLTAAAVHGSTPLWFDIYPPNGGPDPTRGVYSTSAVLDPGFPNRGTADNATGHWNIWGVGLIALSAGCYDFTASWASGSWHTIIAVGS
jgi:hypothetical protein